MTEGARWRLITHLIDLKFHNASNDEEGCVYAGPPCIHYGTESEIYALEAYHRATNEIVDELQRLSTAELEQRYVELEPDIEKAERERFFNQPYANADFAHWCKATGWRIDEGIALFMGKAPELVNWESVEEYVLISSFAKEYMKNRHLALRAKEMGKLSDPATPEAFLAWAKQNEIKYPVELEQHLKARATSTEDAKCNLSSSKSGATKMYESTQKLLGGIVSAQYDYEKEPAEVIKQIVEDLEAVGISMGPETVRKHIDLAIELVERKKRTAKPISSD